MIYEVRKSLKNRIKMAGLVIRDIAQFINKPPSTVANMLNGWTPLTPEVRNEIENFITLKEKGKKSGK